METKSSAISKFEHSDSILNHIINCANCALQNEDAFRIAMANLASEIRNAFDSEYCSIGVVMDGYAEDIIISYDPFEDKKLVEQQKKDIETVKRASINVDDNFVIYALKSIDRVSMFSNDDKDRFTNYDHYQSILLSNNVINSCVIPIRDTDNKNYGFIKLINTNNSIDYEHDILPFADAFLGLVQIIINNKKNKQELIRQNNLLKDADFYNRMQEKKDNIHALLNSIMDYLSKEFNAAVISFRIPLLNGHNKEILFYLRSIFVHQSIGTSKQQELIDIYNRERYVKNNNDMPVANELWCEHQGKILESKESLGYSNFGLDLDDNTFIIPIFRDLDNGYKRINPSRNKDIFGDDCGHHECIDIIRRLYGIFRLRISNIDLSQGDDFFHIDYEEIKGRLASISRQITLLLNSIVNRYENESLQKFQIELKNSSFIKIQDFDKRCVEIIKESIHAKICSIYRYDERLKYLVLSATTAKNIYYKTDNQGMIFNTEQIKDSCFFNVSIPNNLLSQVYKTKKCEYVLNIKDTQIHQSLFIEYIKDRQVSSMAIPMIKKDGSCSGVVLLIGKEAHQHSISTAYWEHDIKSVEFIVSIMTRISESDTERLTFLSQLSHEMLVPVTELVYDNDLTVNIAERDPNSFPRRQLISKLRENIDRNMLFKYIISDTEYIYSSTKKNLDYNIVRQDQSQKILLSAIRLVEKEANFNGLTIRTNISQMPPLYFDKERIMQVFINLLKNAIKYSYRNTIIDIYYHMGNNGFHEICFANYGIGIEQNERKSIFELFNRGENAKKKTVRGTGMGLYIVRNIMKAHGGDCFVKRNNCPTEFVITFPNN